MIRAIRPVLGTFILRTIFLWIVARILFMAVSLMPGPLPRPTGIDGVLSITPHTAVLLSGVVVLLVMSDIRALRERAFLANLGVGLRAIAAVAFCVAAVLEAIVAVALAAL